MGRRKLERKLKQGQEHPKETVTHFESLELKGNFPLAVERQSVYCLQFSLDRKYLVVGYADGCIQALTYTDGKPEVYKIFKRKTGDLPVTCLRFNRINHQVFYASSSDGKVYGCNLDDGKVWEVTEEKPNEINGMDFNVAGDEFVTGGKDLHVRLYDVETSNMLTKWRGISVKDVHQPTRSHGQRIFCLKYKPDDRNIFLSGGWENTVKVWDSRLKDAVIKDFPGPHICGDSIDIEGHKVVTGSWTQHDALKVWDFRYNKVLQTLPFHIGDMGEGQTDEDTGAYIYNTQFADRNTVLAGGSGTRSLQAISLCDEKVIGEIKLHGGMSRYTHEYRKGGPPPTPVKDNTVQALDSTDGGRHVAFGGTCQELKIAALVGGTERELTEDELNPKD